MAKIVPASQSDSKFPYGRTKITIARVLWANRSSSTRLNPLTRSEEIAEALAISQDTAVDSLARLEMRGKVRNTDDTQYWHIRRR
jgi:hypothetical protein